MTDELQRSSGRVPLVQCSVLYFGSAVPLETVVGLDSFKMPLRERYSLTDGHLLGIDATLIVYSAGMLVRYTADEASSAWFPIQALHVCAALKAFRTPAGRLDFAAVNSPLTKDSRHPPVFAFTNRRTKGIKVLECHMFVCKSVTEATTLVQTCMTAYEQKEGWLDEDPFRHANDSLPKIVPADAASKYVESGFYTSEGIRDASDVGLLKAEYARVPLQGFLQHNGQELINKYNVYGYEDNGKQEKKESTVATQQQPPFNGAYSIMTASAWKNSTGRPTGTPQTQYMVRVPEGYFTGMSPYGSMPFMIVPAPYFHPGESRLKQSKTQKKIQKSEKTHRKSKAATKTDEESEDEIIEEYYYVKSPYAPTYLSTTVQDTRAMDNGIRRGTMPSSQIESQQAETTARYTAGEVDHQYITRSVPNIAGIGDDSQLQQRYVYGSFQRAGNSSRSVSQNVVDTSRQIKIVDDPSNREVLEEPIPDYPTDPADLYSDTRIHRPSPEIHVQRLYESEARRTDYPRVTSEMPRGLRHQNDNLNSPSTEPEDKRGYADLIGDLGYLP